MNCRGRTRAWDRVYCCQDRNHTTEDFYPFRALQVKKRADERTRTADLISLRVIGQVLQEFAEGCKCRISKPYSLLCCASYCTVLRSRWYQSGINIASTPRFTGSSQPTAGIRSTWCRYRSAIRGLQRMAQVFSVSLFASVRANR